MTASELLIRDWSSDVCSSDLIAHLVEARRDQAAEPDDVGLLLLRFLKNAGTGHHDAEVDHLVVVALEHDADDVLADIVHVALDGGHQDLAVGLHRTAGLLGLDEGQQVGDRLFHHAGGFHHLGRSEEHTSELQSLLRISYAGYGWKKTKAKTH